MKNSKKNLSVAGQSTTEVKKSQKHDANLQKNSTLYFQIGLILCLLATYALFEMQFQDKKIVVEPDVAVNVPIEIDYVEPFQVEVIKPKDPDPLPSTELKDVYTEVEDDTPIVETKIITPEEPKEQSEPVDDGIIPEIDNEVTKEPVIVPFVSIEKVPVYPGCERKKTNEAKRKCMSDKINKLVNRRFNTGIADDYGISGRQRISTQFTIDKNGNVVDIKVRGTHPALEKEAKRLINKIPKMKPGVQRNKPVGVIYTLPIVFDAMN